MTEDETLQAVLDLLPPRSRMFINESPVPISPSKWADLLEQFTEAELIDVVTQAIPDRGRDLVLRRYGRAHPQAVSTDFSMPKPKRSLKMARDSERVRILAKRAMR